MTVSLDPVSARPLPAVSTTVPLDSVALSPLPFTVSVLELEPVVKLLLLPVRVTVLEEPLMVRASLPASLTVLDEPVMVAVVLFPRVRLLDEAVMVSPVPVTVTAPPVPRVRLSLLPAIPMAVLLAMLTAAAETPTVSVFPATVTVVVDDASRTVLPPWDDT